MKIRKLLFGLIILIGIAALSYLFLVTETFDEKKWKNPNSTTKSSPTRSDRQKMLRSALKNIEKKSKVEIVRVLGPGDNVGYFPESKTGLVYLLGPQRGLWGIDSEWLLLSFDKNEILKHYEIATD